MYDRSDRMPIIGLKFFRASRMAYFYEGEFEEVSLFICGRIWISLMF